MIFRCFSGPVISMLQKDVKLDCLYEQEFLSLDCRHDWYEYSCCILFRLGLVPTDCWLEQCQLNQTSKKRSD